MSVDISFAGQIIIAILGIAYPIILQLITRLNESYFSLKIVKLFDEEFDTKSFKLLLYLSIFSIFIWSLNLHPIELFQNRSWIVDHSADILVFITSFFLTFFFLKLITNIFIYYSPVKLTPYLLKKYKKNNSKEVFNAIGDVLIYSAKTNNNEVLDTLLNFYYEEFKLKRKESNGGLVVYPNYFYSLINETVYVLAKKGIDRNIALEYRAAGTIWLLGDVSDEIISDKTYDCKWNNLITGIKYDQNSIFSAYWETTFYYFFYNFSHKETIYNDNYEVTNQNEIDDWIKRRNRFLDFQLYIGGLVIHMKNHFALKKICTFTNSQPSNYLLSPKSITIAFKKYVYFSDPYDIDFRSDTRRFFFPELRGFGSEKVIKQSVCDFLVFICLKLGFFNKSPNQQSLPEFPNKQFEIRTWLECIKLFRSSAIRIFNDYKGTNLIPLELLDVKIIEDYFDLFSKKLNGHYKIKANTAEINTKKEKDFYIKTAEIFENNFKDFSSLSSEKLIKNKYNEFEINGSYYIFDKDPFTEHPESHHVNYDTFISTDFSKNSRNQFLKSFESNKAKSYVVKEEDVLESILKLKLTKKHIILDFGLNLKSKILNSKNMEKYNDKILNKFEIVEIDGFYHKQPSFFVLRKKDLPQVLMKDIIPEDIKKLSLQKISEEFKIYSSIIDFNKMDQSLIDIYGGDLNADTIKTKVLIHFSFNYLIRWKNNPMLIQIYQYSDFYQNSLCNTLSEIDPI